jgi:hypothetical protein
MSKGSEIDRVRCLFGGPSRDGLVYQLDGSVLTVTGAEAEVVLLDLGPGRELLLIHRAAAAACLGGHS